MKNSNNHSFSHKIKLRIRVLWIIFVLMLAYMVIISELGGGDSRIMTPLAESVSRIIFFGGLIFVCYRIYFNKKLLERELMLTDNDNELIIDDDDTYERLKRYLIVKKVDDVYKVIFINNLDKTIFKIISGENSSPYILSVSAIGLRGEVIMHSLEEQGFISI